MLSLSLGLFVLGIIATARAACSCDNDCAFSNILPCFTGFCDQNTKNCSASIEATNPRCQNFAPCAGGCAVNSPCAANAKCVDIGYYCACVIEEPMSCSTDSECADLYDYGECIRGKCFNSTHCVAEVTPTCAGSTLKYMCAGGAACSSTQACAEINCTFVGAPVSACLCPPATSVLTPCTSVQDCAFSCAECVDSICVERDPAVYCSGNSEITDNVSQFFCTLIYGQLSIYDSWLNKCTFPTSCFTGGLPPIQPAAYRRSCFNCFVCSSLF